MNKRLKLIGIFCIIGVSSNFAMAWAEETKKEEKKEYRMSAGLMIGANRPSLAPYDKTHTSIGVDYSFNLLWGLDVGFSATIWYDAVKVGELFGIPINISDSLLTMLPNATYHFKWKFIDAYGGAAIGPFIFHHKNDLTDEETYRVRLAFGPKAGVNFRIWKRVSLGFEANYILVAHNTPFDLKQAYFTAKFYF